MSDDNKRETIDAPHDNSDSDDEPAYQIAQDVDIENPELDSDHEVDKMRQTKETSNAPTFSIDADSLELFMSDQLRKPSVTSADEKAPGSSSSSKKSSTVTDPSSEKKKKKKSRKSKSAEADGEKSEKKKKHRSKDGKKREKSKQSDKGGNDYELL